MRLGAAREYESAASCFGLAELRGLRSPLPWPLLAYALWRLDLPNAYHHSIES